MSAFIVGSDHIHALITAPPPSLSHKELFPMAETITTKLPPDIFAYDNEIVLLEMLVTELTDTLDSILPEFQDYVAGENDEEIADAHKAWIDLARAVIAKARTHQQRAAR